MNVQTNTTATLNNMNRIETIYNFRESTMNHKSIITLVLSMMTVVALLIVTGSPVSANCVTVNQIRDRQDARDTKKRTGDGAVDPAQRRVRNAEIEERVIEVRQRDHN